jgi:hypothetical protein
MLLRSPPSPLLTHGRLLLSLAFIALCVLIQSTDSVQKRQRFLYDRAREDNLVLKVRTYSTIVDPVGISVGEYANSKGLFVSSFETNSISFISLQHEGHTQQQMEAVTISGGTYNIDSDGSFDTASFAEPSRLTFDDKCQLLFVVCKKNRVIRVLNFKNQSVQTLHTDQDTVLTFASSDQYQLNFPDFDIQSVAGDSLYVTDTTTLYRVVASDQEDYCDSIASSATLAPYYSLSHYMQIHEYPSNARIFSVLPDEARSFLYVAIGEGKNVILRIPMDAVYSNQYASIAKIVGNEGSSWSGLATTQTPPVATNGNAYQDITTLAFPMHLQMDRDTDSLFWTECYPYVGEFLLGSLTVRRLGLSTGG